MVTNLIGTSASQVVAAVEGDNSAPGTGGVGVCGKSTGPSSAGVEGLCQDTSTGGTGQGGYFSSTAGSGGGVLSDGQLYGVCGRSYGASGSGVLGEVHTSPGMAVKAYCVSAPDLANYGVYAYGNCFAGVRSTTSMANSYAFYSDFATTAGQTGIYSRATGTSACAGYFNGPVTVTGYLSKSGGGFLIDHPEDPANKTLNHNFVESPEMKNVYDGVIELDKDGNATVSMPSYFEHLNDNVRYQLTAVGSSMPNLHISKKMKNGSFSISGGAAKLEVSWQITGVRKDVWAIANCPPVEKDKDIDEKGFFLAHKEHGQDESKSIHQAKINKTSKSITKVI